MWNSEWLKGCWEAIKRKLYNWYYLILSIFCFTIKFVLSGYLFIFYLSTIVFMNKISTWFLAVVFLIPRKRSKQEIFWIFFISKIRYFDIRNLNSIYQKIPCIFWYQEMEFLILKNYFLTAEIPFLISENDLLTSENNFHFQ